MKPVMAENNLCGMNHFRIELPAGHRALREGRESLIHGTYLVTTTTLGRQPRFADFEVAAGVCRCFRSREALADAHLLAWVLMPDHAHWLIELGETEPLSRVVARLKGVSARAANHVVGVEGPMWAPAFHDRALRSWRDVRLVARYIVCNPVRAGLVQCLGDYPYWDTAWTGQR